MLARMIIFVFLTFSISGFSLGACFKNLHTKPMERKARARLKVIQRLAIFIKQPWD